MERPMRTAKHTQISLIGAAAALMIGMSFMVSGSVAQDLHLQPGTDCSKLLATEQKDCLRQMHKYQLQQEQQQAASGQQTTSGSTHKPSRTVLRLGGGLGGN